MIPAAFAYDRATSIDEALDLLVTHGADAKIIAGGQSLLPLMKLRLARPERLIDIGRIDSLRGVRELPDGRLAIGSLTTYAQLLGDSRVTGLALMADALPRIGDVQVRNRGTIGGAIAHADPAADVPALLLALDAEVVARSSSRGERVIPITAFFEGAFTTALQPDELLTEIRLPAPSGSYGSAYRMLEQPASGLRDRRRRRGHRPDRERRGRRLRRRSRRGHRGRRHALPGDGGRAGAPRHDARLDGDRFGGRERLRGRRRPGRHPCRRAVSRPRLPASWPAGRSRPHESGSPSVARSTGWRASPSQSRVTAVRFIVTRIPGLGSSRTPITVRAGR